jgi:hypothetical protein
MVAPGGDARMPLYEYVCRDRRHGFEALVLGADVPSCPGVCALD